MTRKRFIKKLMAFNCSRDQAVEYADLIREAGIPYDIFYSRLQDKLFTLIANKFENYILYGDSTL